MSEVKKVTVELPSELLEKAQRQTKQGITETIRRGLRLLAEAEAFEKMILLKGKQSYDCGWEDLKEDR